MHSSLHIANKILDIAGEGHDITPMKLLKLVYIAHGWMLGLHNRRLVSEDVMAWQYGPVIPELYKEVKEYKDQPISRRLGDDDTTPNFTREEENIIEQVCDKYGGFGGITLSSMTHADSTPWHTIWHDTPWEEIPNDRIATYYRGLADG